jgi:hypothetical protein
MQRGWRASCSSPVRDDFVTVFHWNSFTRKSFQKSETGRRKKRRLVTLTREQRDASVFPKRTPEENFVRRKEKP